jgi:hypothetical protein
LASKKEAAKAAIVTIEEKVCGRYLHFSLMETKLNDIRSAKCEKLF